MIIGVHEQLDGASAKPLKGLRVGISGAVPEREFWKLPDTDRAILLFVAQLSGLVFKLGGRVVHGSHPSFTPVIARQAERFAMSTQHDTSLTLLTSRLWPIDQDFLVRSSRVADIILTPKIGRGDCSDAKTRNDSLTALRLTLAHEVNVLVAVGGKLHRGAANNPGVLEELSIARWRGAPCFVVASLGGFAGELDPTIVGQFSSGNELDEVQSQDLIRRDTDIEATVGLLIAHLVHYRETFANRTTTWPDIELSARSSAHETGARDADVSKKLIKQSGARFAKLRKAINARDSSQVAELLSTPPLSPSGLAQLWQMPRLLLRRLFGTYDIRD
jgi:hypothetical protein